jgi:hypothetical protein
MINPLLKVLKNDDVVLMSMEGNFTTSVQIVKLKSVIYQPEDEECSTNWLEFNGEVLFTTERVHSSNHNLIFMNCMAIKEILNPFLIEKYTHDYRMFPPTENQLTDAEFEYGKIRMKQVLEN